MKPWIRVTVTALLLALILWVVPWSELWQVARRLDAAIWLAVFAGFAAGHIGGAFKWRLNVNIGRAGLKPVDAIQCYAAGLFANLCLPSIVGGDALKAALAGRVTGRYEAAVFGGLTERLIDTLALLLLLVTGAILSREAVVGWASPVLVVTALVALAAAVLFLPLLLRVRLERWPARLRRPAGRAMVAMRRLRRRPHLAAVVLLSSLAIQGWFVLLNAWLGRGIGIELPLAFWFLAVPLAKAITLAPISLGGFGLREATLAGILSVAGVPTSSGVVVSLLWQTVLVAAGLAGGALWLLLGLRERARTGAGHGARVDLARARSARKSAAAPAPGSRHA